MDEKSEFLNLIRSNIGKYGYHITIVNSPIEPRYAYTVGLSEIYNFELIFAGGIYYLKEELFQIFDAIIKELKIGNQKVTIDSLGTFSLSNVDTSWSQFMMLGVVDYYKLGIIKAFQIIPDPHHYTLDIPDMSKELDISKEPVWQWLVRKWDYTIPENSTVVTNIDAMLGEAITEVVRCENDEWEMFAGAGPDVQKEDIRVVSLGTIIGIDKSLLPALSLNIGKGLWRESGDSDWNSWG